MRLITFLRNKKVNFPPHFLSFLLPEDLRDAFRVAGGAFGRPWLQWIKRLTRHTQDFTMEGIHVVGAWPGGLGDISPVVGSRGKAPVGVLGTKSPRS